MRALDGQAIRETLQVLTVPVSKLASIDPAGCQIEHDAFLFANLRVDLGTVQNEKRLHGSVSDPFIGVHKGMALDQREAERRRFLDQRGIELKITKGCPGLGDGRLERAKIPDPGCAAGRL